MSKALSGRYLTTAEVSRRWGVCEGTLRNYRHKREGPAWVKVGNSVFYEYETLREFERTNRRVVIKGEKE